MIGMIAAVTINGVIGVDGKLPFDYAADMKHFRKTTADSTVIMGRKTFEGIGRPLPKRRNIVISSQQITTPGVETFHSLTEALMRASVIPAVAHFDEEGNEIDMSPPIWLIGGSCIYEEGMNFADKILLTLTPEMELRKPAVRFPWISPFRFELKSLAPLCPEDATCELQLATYERIKKSR
jgi:dihydrofolate reductase